MSVTIEATYERGVLKLSQPLPLDEHETVRVTVHSDKALAELPATDADRHTAPHAEESRDFGEGEMLNIWLEIPRSPTARTMTVSRGEPILPGPFNIDESDLAPE